MKYELSESQQEKLEEKSISEDELDECISNKVDEGMDQDQAVAICLSELEEGSSKPEKSDGMNAEEIEEHKEIVEENKESIQRKNFRLKGSEVEVKETDGHTTVNVPIQALTEDRDGDFINEKGQESIIRQLKSGKVPLVPNHGVGDSRAMYGFEDIFGQFVDGENRNGTTIGTARLREGNDKADELVDLLEQDMPVGFSVGFIPTEKEPREKDEGNGIEISDLDLMEVSAVGIPSNPQAVPQAMGSAVAMAKNAGMEKDQIIDKIKSAFEKTDAMTQKEQEDGQEQNDSKSKEQNTEKQITEDEMNAVLGAVGGALDAHMDAAMQDIEEELEAMVEGETEENEMDEEDEEEEDTVETDETHGDEEDDEEEMSQESEEPEHQENASDHSEDDKSSESEEQEDKGLDEEEKQKMNDNDTSEGRKMNEIENEEEDKEKSEADDNIDRIAEKGEFW